MKKIFFLIFLTACSSNKLNNNTFNFDMNLTYDEFKIFLKEYDKNKGYPNINN